MTFENPLENPQAMNYLLAGLLRRLESIESKLDKKVAYLSVENRGGGYRQHLREGKSRKGTLHRKPENFGYLLSEFEREFRGKNIAEITPDQIEIFIANNWPDASSGTIKQRKRQTK